MGAFSGTSARNEAIAANQALLAGQNAGIDAINAGEPLALSSLSGGYDGARTAYGDASALYAPYASTGTSALTTLGNSLGLNGADGNAAATAAFQASPGAAWEKEQALDGVNRAASATGSLGSGNTEVALENRADDLANQQYGNWQNNLKGLSQLGLTATGAQAGLQKGIGDLDVGEGQDEANLFSGDAAKRAGIYTGAAQGVAGVYSNLSNHASDAGSNTWNAVLGIGKSLASLGGSAIGKWG